MADIVDLEFSEWRRVMAANLDSVFLCSRALARRLIEKGRPGRIVNIVSQAAFNGSKRGKTPYSASKARRCPSPYPSPRRSPGTASSSTPWRRA